ncbi:MAG: HEAT repeat domain-containing protein [Gemmataceae bacterium]
MIRLFLLLACLTTFQTGARADDDPTFNGRKMSDWLTMLTNDSVARKRKAAAVALGQIAADQKSTLKFILPALANSLRQDPSPGVRGQAAITLGQQPPETAGAFVSDLAECLRTEKDTSVKREVSITLGRIGKLAKGGVLPLIAQLKDTDAGVRAASAEALGRIGPDAKGAAKALLDAYPDKDPVVQRQVVFALGRIEADEQEPIVDVLVNLLKTEKSRDLRYETVMSLGIIVPKTVAAAGAVVGTLSDPDVETRKQACLTLARMGFVGVKWNEVIRKTVAGDEDKDVRALAVRALTAAYGSDAAETIPFLTARLSEDRDYEVRLAIVEELGSFGAAGKSAIPALRGAMKDSQIKVREAATRAVKQIEKPIPKPMEKPS